MGNQVYGYRSTVLKRLGFASYRQYLASSLWKSIRSQVMHRDGHFCRKCGKASAEQVHHTSYGAKTLSGKRIDTLFAVCGWCHRDLEFDGDDKRPGSEVMKFKDWLPISKPPGTPHAPSKKMLAKKALLETRKVTPATENQLARIRQMCEILRIPIDEQRLKVLTQSQYAEWIASLQKQAQLLNRKARTERLGRPGARRKRDSFD